MKKYFAVLIAFVLMVFVTSCYNEPVEKKLILSSKSPDGSYTVFMYQIGEPAGLFGSAGAELVLKNTDNKVLEKVRFGLRNDGRNASAGNVKEITWLEDQVKIIMCEFDTTQQFTYVLNYDSAI